ncbi:MAG: hypothetical protein HY081_08490 [Gammaproteobacteria bacterium]|nr:hypothetical protein [Gammaproteobacteria bacterium]
MELGINEVRLEGQHLFIGILRNITERKRVQQALAKHTHELARSNAELEQFARIASHDLQEPLRKVQAFGDRIKEKYSHQIGAEGLDYLERMLNATVRMQALIDGLLSFARVNTRAQAFATVDLNQVAQEVITDLEIRIHDTQARVEIKPLPIIEAEALQLRQLLQNLIGNALKFRRPGIVPEIRVSAHPVNVTTPADGAENKRYEIIVEDNGIGFDEKYLDRIFGIFQRLHGRHEYEGSGVGLAICRKIAEYHGGDITARSQPGQGAKFIVTLPAIQSARSP